MAHPGDSRGNMARPSNPSGHFTPSSPTPATIGAQASQALFQENQRDASIGAWAPQLGHPTANDTLVPPAVAPQAFHFQPERQPHNAMPLLAGVPNAMPPLQHLSGTAAVQVQPLHGDALAARVEAAINTLAYQPFQPNSNYAHVGWSQSQVQPLPPPPPQAPPAPRYAALQPHAEPGDSGNHPLPPPPLHSHILQHPMVAMAPPNWNSTAPAPAPVATDGYGATSWAPRPMLAPSGWPGSWTPPVRQQPGAGGQASSWAWAPPAQQRPGMPAASRASGSAQAQVPRVTGKKIFEEFLVEAGVFDRQAVDQIFLDELAEDMLGDGQAELGAVERDDGFVSLGDVLLALGAVSSSGPSTHQVRVPAPAQEALGAGAAGSSSGPSRHQARMPAQEAALRDQAAAAEARERRSRRMGKRKEAAARHQHAAPRGSQNGPGAA